MRNILDLIRWKNLAIIIITMVLIRYCILRPLLGEMTAFMMNANGAELSLDLQSEWYDFVLLVAATVLISAAGYVINDYFDIRTDFVNRGSVIVGTRISRRHAMLLHGILNVAGITAGFLASWKAGFAWMGTLFIVVAGLLYFYSASYKRQFLIGNIIISLLSAMVPFLVILYEWPPLYRFYAANAAEIPAFRFLFVWVGGFSVFAFTSTLAREIIKDIEDFEGDRAYGRDTLPVVLGIPASKIIAIIILLITILMLALAWIFFINDFITLVYMSVMLVLPLFHVIYRLIVSRNRIQVRAISNMMKIIMLAGISYSVVVRLIITRNLY
jgi:4-hydroxybenzoate polyprenyltransferase